ncbi:MAG: hypothetical protein ACC700_15345 [Anaerolineales bacterium]
MGERKVKLRHGEFPTSFRKRLVARFISHWSVSHAAFAIFIALALVLVSACVGRVPEGPAETPAAATLPPAPTSTPKSMALPTSSPVDNLTLERTATQEPLLEATPTANPRLPVLGSTWPDELGDTPVGEEFIDIDTFAFAIDQNQGTTHMAVLTFGLFPENISDLRYTFAIDLDDNPGTGGAPADIGVPSTIQGVELIGQVEVEVNDGVVSGTATVLKFQNGAFVEITDPSIEARIQPMETAGISANQPLLQQDTFPTGQIVQLILSNALRGPTAAHLNAAVVSENPSTGTVDSVEGEIFLTPPTFPVCQVSPAGALIGWSVTVTASELPPNNEIEILLADQQVGAGTTDGSGNASAEILIPVDAPLGVQSVVVHALGSAVTADCAINLLARPVFDEPPSPSSGTIFVVSVGDTLTFEIQASDADANDQVSLGAIGIPAGASFAIPVPSNPVSTMFSWTPTARQIGGHVIVFTATDDIGLPAPSHSVTVNVQAAH